ncbi:MAG TPA: DUF1428 domain-containing protein [Acetobacteraceae bacterium]|nr:DUF1428 domain-containing protein [Acetobacteraceae bacterium]
MSYVMGFVLPVPTANKDQYREMAAKASPIFKEYGALQHVEAWGDDIPDGKVTDFKMAVKARPDETVVFSWLVWPDKATYEAAQKKIMTDERMKGLEMPFDARRMIIGGFSTLLETKA